jgi:menaquinone-dependent protoporphyrinogen oxidase
MAREEEPMAKVLVVYGTAYGQTAKIVRRFADKLEESGVHTVMMQGDMLPPDIRLDLFDGYVVAGSVQYGKHQKYLEEFVRRYRDQLNRCPAALVSVCGAMSSKRPEGEAEAQKYRLDFLKRTGWSPRFTHSFAGALPYTHYGYLTRLMMKAISRRNGGPTDTSRDWEFTDWEQVDQFAADFAHAINPALVPA